MIIFTSNKSTKFCQIILRIKRFIHKRKVVPFFSLMAVECRHKCLRCHGVLLMVYTALFHHKMLAKNRIEIGLN